MAFPTSPTNGQTAVQNGITYTYASATNSWTRVPGTANSISNGTSNVIIASNGNVTVGVAGTSNVVTITETSFVTSGNITLSGSSLQITGANYISGNYFSGNGSLLTSITGGNVAGQVGNALVAGTVYTAAQPNITSVGSLASLTVSGLTTATGGVKTGNIIDSTGTNTISVSSTTVGVIGNLDIGTGGVGNLSVSGKSNLGPVGNVIITGGSANYILKTDGTGNLSWIAQSGGGATITDDTSTNSTYYPVYATSSSGTLTTAGITTTKLQFNPSTGQLTVQDLNTLSDATLKEDSHVIDDPFIVLNQLFGMGFTWSESKRKSYGLLAQMLEKVLPELVSVNAQGKKTVNYIPIIAFLIEAVKKQQQDIEALKKDKY